MLDRLAMTTDYVTSKGDPEPYLRGIAEAGFTSIHWCHQWCTDFLYGASELSAIEQMLVRYGLALNDLHASEGVEKGWGSPIAYQRQAGVELIVNRIAMTRRLGGDVVVLHLPSSWKDAATWPVGWDAVRRSLDDLAPLVRRSGVRIALENTPDNNFAPLDQAFGHLGPDVLGLCYDSGHGCVAGDGLNRLEERKDRLIALHLHDSDGASDKHWAPMVPGGQVDWPRLARIIATSGYAKKVMTIESNMRNVTGQSERDFLAECATSGTKFAAMVEAAREQ
jgi:sugar phosphate isomerase/epimerase